MNVDLDEETQLLGPSGRTVYASNAEKGYGCTVDRSYSNGCDNESSIISAGDHIQVNLHDEAVHDANKPVHISLIVSLLCIILVAATFVDTTSKLGVGSNDISHFFGGFQIRHQQHLLSTKRHKKNGHNVRLSKSGIDSDEGRNNIASLDGAEADCGNSPLTSIEFKASGGSGGTGWFAYSCGELSSPSLSQVVKSDVRRTSSTAAGDIMTLQNQKLKCPNNSLLAGLWAHRDSRSTTNASKFYFEYKCNHYTVSTAICSEIGSGFRNAGMDLINLAGHSVNCPANTAMSSFRGMTSGEDQFQLSGRCCDAIYDEFPIEPSGTAAKTKSNLMSDVDPLLSDDHQDSSKIRSEAQEDGESLHPDALNDENEITDTDNREGGVSGDSENSVDGVGDASSDENDEGNEGNQANEESTDSFDTKKDGEIIEHSKPTVSPTEPVKTFVTDSFLAGKCPGSLIFRGINDPRDVLISKAMIGGMGPPDKPRGVDDKDIPAQVFQTGQFNQHESHWIVATKNDMSFHMVMIEIRSNSNKAYGCVTQAGYFSLHSTDRLDYDTVMKAWAGRDIVDVATCNDCVGYGISKGLTLARTPYTYAGSVNRYQSSSYIEEKCPGQRLGFARSMKNVTVDEIDSYAGLAFLGGANIDGSLVTSEGVKPHPAVVFYNTKVGDARSYIAAYVDMEASELRMVEIHLTVDADAGRVRVCAPLAKTYSDVPDLVDSSNIVSFWNDAAKMNVASCQKCAGYGVTMFRFNVEESVAASPVPTAEPTLMPSPEPSLEPSPEPTMKPTEIPDGSVLAPDAADGKVDGVQMVVALPVAEPTEVPIITPTFAPISGPTFHPVAQPTSVPVNNIKHPPTQQPSSPKPKEIETEFPISDPTVVPIARPTLYPVMDPTKEPVVTPTQEPTPEPTIEKLEPCTEKNYNGDVIPVVTVDGVPLVEDSAEPTYEPSLRPTHGPTLVDPVPTLQPTQEPTTAIPTREPTFGPTFVSQEIYGMETTASPTFAPTLQPTEFPSAPPSAAATNGATLGGPCLDTGEVFAPADDNVGATYGVGVTNDGSETHSSSSISDEPSGDFAADILRYHNDLREQCSSNTQSMTWNQDLADYAQSYAESLATQNNCRLSHVFGGHASYSDKNAGENLAMYMSTTGVDAAIAAVKAVNGWAGEGYGEGATSGTTGHYTAMMWKDTSELGCGYGINDATNCIVTACNYASVAPNMMGQYDTEVLCTNPFSIAGNRRLSTSDLDLSMLKECTEYYGLNYKKNMKMVKLSGRSTIEAVSIGVNASTSRMNSTRANVTSVEEMSSAERRQFYLDHFAKPKPGSTVNKRLSPIARKVPAVASVVEQTNKVSPKKDVRLMNTTERRQFYLDHFSPEAMARRDKMLSSDKHSS